MERLGLGIFRVVPVDLRQVVEARGRVGMFRPQRLPPDRQRPLDERLGLGIPALVKMNLSQSVEARG